MKHFQKEFDAFLEYWPDEDSSIRDLRLKAFNKFKEIGLPNKKWEEWQFTDFSSMNKLNFRLSKNYDLPTLPKTIPGRISNTYLLFMINGHYQPQLSEIPSNISIKSGTEHFKSNPQLYSFDNSLNPFLSLNTSMMNSGIPIYIEENVIIDKPIQVIYLTTNISDQLMNHPRFSFNIEKNSEATIIEHYIGATSTSYFINTVTQVNIEKNAKLNHVRIQEDEQTSNHTACTFYKLNEYSQLNSYSISSGAKLFRHNIKLTLNNKSADANLNGLSLIKGKQHHDQHIVVDHKSDSCQSNQLFKYILSDKSSGVFNGRVIVRNGTSQTNANQTNRNLLLSPSSLMNANPQLEIYADDVKCSHGSTTGQIDPEALFYLRSRGISKERAIGLIVGGFAKDVLDNINNVDIKTFLSKKVSTWLESNLRNE